jgi:hypothetical protein
MMLLEFFEDFDCNYHQHQMLMLINNTIEPLYMQGPNPLVPIEFSIRTLFSGFETIAARYAG